MKFKQWGYIRKRGEAKQVPIDVRLRIDSIPPLKETDDFDDSDRYGFRIDLGQNSGIRQLEIQGEIYLKERELAMYNEDTQEWSEAQIRYANQGEHGKGNKLRNWFRGTTREA